MGAIMKKRMWPYFFLGAGITCGLLFISGYCIDVYRTDTAKIVFIICFFLTLILLAHGTVASMLDE